MQIWLIQVLDMYVKASQIKYRMPRAKTWTFDFGQLSVKIAYDRIVKPNLLENPYKLLMSRACRKVQVFAFSEVANANMACSIPRYAYKGFSNQISHA